MNPYLHGAAIAGIILGVAELCWLTWQLYSLWRFGQKLKPKPTPPQAAAPLSPMDAAVRKLPEAQLLEHIRLIESGECDGFRYYPETDRWEPVLND